MSPALQGGCLTTGPLGKSLPVPFKDRHDHALCFDQNNVSRIDPDIFQAEKSLLISQQESTQEIREQSRSTGAAQHLPANAVRH